MCRGRGQQPPGTGAGHGVTLVQAAGGLGCRRDGTGRDGGASASSPPRGAACQPVAASKRGLLRSLRVKDINSQHGQPERNRQPSSSRGAAPPGTQLSGYPISAGQSRSCPRRPPGAGGVPTPAPCPGLETAGRDLQGSAKTPREESRMHLRTDPCVSTSAGLGCRARGCRPGQGTLQERARPRGTYHRAGCMSKRT